MQRQWGTGSSMTGQRHTYGCELCIKKLTLEKKEGCVLKIVSCGRCTEHSFITEAAFIFLKGIIISS